MATTAGRIELPAGVRVIRRLMPPEVPWPAALVRTHDGASGMLVESGRLNEWGGWSAGSTGHVLAPLDVLRNATGHDVLLPLCSERLEALVSRRGLSLELTPGETVTLAVSVLRGMVEIAEREEPAANGSWWLTDEGRPVFVDDSDGPTAVTSSAELLERLSESSPPGLGDTLRLAAETVREPRILAREAVDLEQRLFDRATAEPLATAPLASARIRRHAADPDVNADPNGEGAPRTWGASLLAAVDTDLADAFSRATTGLWRRLRRSPRGGHRRPWAIAGCLAAGVIAAGLLWPAAEGAAVAGEDGSAPSTSPGGGVAPTPWTPSPAASSIPSPASDDLATVTEALLRARNDCRAAGGGGCLADVLEDPARAVPAGVVDADPSDRTLTLLDEFGGVAVLRAEAVTTATAPQLVVITDSDGAWLIRDVHDVAAEP